MTDISDAIAAAGAALSCGGLVPGGPVLIGLGILQLATAAAFLWALHRQGGGPLFGSRRLEAEIADLRIKCGTDFLTGLLNRRGFAERAEAQLAAARRHNWPAALVMFDIDYFKSVNDRHGHAIGDLVLAEVAALCKRCLREDDIVGRHGGEEFAVLLSHGGLMMAETAAERLRVAIETAIIALPGGQRLSVTASFGCAANGKDGLEALVREADQALYAAKRLGRNRVVSTPPTPLAEPVSGPGRAAPVRRWAGA